MPHISNEPLTLANSAAASPDLLLSEIDSRIVRVRPSSTPIDQISRMGGSRMAGAMKVEYYSVDTKKVSARIVSYTRTEGSNAVTLTTNPAGLLEASETFTVPSMCDDSGAPAVFYVVGRDKQTNLVSAVQIGVDSAAALGKGVEIVRMGRAAAELDVQTPQFQALPSKNWNLCQIFKAQVEESTLHSLSNKEVGWTFNDQEEVAVIDMRLGMEKNFLFGCRATVRDPEKGEDVCLTGGIWNQTSHDFSYPVEDISNDDLALGIVREAFRTNSGSRRKVLIAGGNLIDRLNRQSLQRRAGVNETVTRWGIDFTEICSKFGSLYVVHSDTFDQCGFPDHGMVIDPEYITKYCFIPMQAERLELKKTGQRNTNAIVITEASCLVLRYPETHMRIIPV